ncbi:hypothetical protein [Sodalis-like endosymbiont of Proechinophthirus fluctus]|uniref:hypothetical protein n=1 Tax=Sodalis-like endosymbiont of Proechinophthirus fluctus TaxID=1462730 RepID=UPI003F7507D8
MTTDTVKFRGAGLTYSYTNSCYHGQIQIENFSAWHNISVATQDNGFVSTDTRLVLNGLLQVKHISSCCRMYSRTVAPAISAAMTPIWQNFMAATAVWLLASRARYRPCGNTPNSIMALA